MTLVPNSPRKRIEYVIKTYRDSKSRAIIPEAVEVALMLLGQDAAAHQWKHTYLPLWHYTWADDPRPIREEMNLVLEEEPTEPPAAYTKPMIEVYVRELYDGMPMNLAALADLSDRHPHDFLVPWVAKELGRLYKAYLRKQVTGADYEQAVIELRMKAPAIALWAEQNRIDVTKVSLADALEAIKDFEVETDEPVPQGEVVYEFDDGYTIQRLTTAQQLDSEGEIMQHCVAGYCQQVQRDEVAIFSLRDAKGQPHATIEWAPYGQMPTYLGWEGTPGGVGSFEQIRGKQNEIPAVKYRPYLQRFINERFYGDALGLLMVAMPGQKIPFAGYTVNEVDFTSQYAWGGVDLSHGDFRGATFNNCIFDEMEDVNFTEADLDGCGFFGELAKCTFDRAHFEAGQFESYMRDCSFADAVIADVSFTEDIYDTDFRGAELQSAHFVGLNITRGDWTDVVLTRHTSFEYVVFDAVDISGLTIRERGGHTADADHVKFSDITLQDMDLSDVSPRVVRRLVTPVTEVEGGLELPPGLDYHSLIEAAE